MLKGIIFDLGGVVFTNGTKKFIDYLVDTYHLERVLVADVIADGELATAYREAKISRDEFWKEATRKLSLPESIEKLEERWIRGYDLIQGTKKIIETLSEKYQVYYLSDNVKERIEPVNARYGFISWFKDGLFSHEVGFRKPDVRIYKAILAKIKFKSEEVVFIDDKEYNLTPAKELGMTTILFTDPESLRRDLKRLGLI